MINEARLQGVFSMARVLLSPLNYSISFDRRLAEAQRLQKSTLTVSEKLLSALQPARPTLTSATGLQRNGDCTWTVHPFCPNIWSPIDKGPETSA